MSGYDLLIAALQRFTFLEASKVVLWLLCAMSAVLLLVTSGRWSMQYETSLKAGVGTSVTFVTGTTLFVLSIISAFYVVDEALIFLSNMWQLTYF